MTVCIAAICKVVDQFVVLAASDRQLTSGNIRFEPALSKMWKLGPHALGLIAGDIAPQAEICRRIELRQPQTVYQAANAYCEELGEYNRTQAERAILFPLGLTMESFLNRQQTMSPDFVNQLYRQFGTVSAEVDTIICGADVSGAHIYMIDEHGCAHCKTDAAFSAIGDGRWHAASQFMFAGYTRDWQIGRALYLIYAAKKHAEVAPGVGPYTDLVILSQFGRVHVTEKLEPALWEAYQKMLNAGNVAWQESSASIEALAEKAMMQKQEPPESTNQSAPESVNPSSPETGQSTPAS